MAVERSRGARTEVGLDAHVARAVRRVEALVERDPPRVLELARGGVQRRLARTTREVTRLGVEVVVLTRTRRLRARLLSVPWNSVQWTKTSVELRRGRLVPHTQPARDSLVQLSLHLARAEAPTLRSTRYSAAPSVFLHSSSLFLTGNSFFSPNPNNAFTLSMLCSPRGAARVHPLLRPCTACQMNRVRSEGWCRPRTGGLLWFDAMQHAAWQVEADRLGTGKEGAGAGLQLSASACREPCNGAAG